MCTSARTEAVAVLAEGGIKLRLQHLQQRLLDQPIRHRRDAELALTSVRLRDLTRRTGWAGTSLATVVHGSRATPHTDAPAVSSIARPSMPAAPLLARTRFHACCMFSLASTAFSSPAPVPFASCRGRWASSLTVSAGLHRVAPPSPLHLRGHLTRCSPYRHGLDHSSSFCPSLRLAPSPTTTASADFSLRLITVALSGMGRDLPR